VIHQAVKIGSREAGVRSGEVRDIEADIDSQAVAEFLLLRRGNSLPYLSQKCPNTLSFGLRKDVPP
jgi:hypothetical protein